MKYGQNHFTKDCTTPKTTTAGMLIVRRSIQLKIIILKIISKIHIIKKNPPKIIQPRTNKNQTESPGGGAGRMNYPLNNEKTLVILTNNINTMPDFKN